MDGAGLSLGGHTFASLLGELDAGGSEEEDGKLEDNPPQAERTMADKVRKKPDFTFKCI
jgi:hypothetical protein